MAIRRSQDNLPGFTLAETAVAVALVTITVLAASVFLADKQRAFNRVYAGAFSSAADGAMTARTVFHQTIRQACSAAGTASVASDGTWIEVLYYSSPEEVSPDRAARFELSEQDLLLRKSVLETGQTLSLQTVSGNVASVEFSLVGGSAQMFLRLEDGVSSQIVNASATMRNP